MRTGRGRDAITTSSTDVVDRNHAVPLYHQLFVHLRDEIVAGALPHGASVPTEHELARSHAVSRITARRALSELAIRGLVERRRRTGTRVVYRAPVPPMEANIDQAVESLLAFGRETAVTVIDISERAADPDIAAQLALAPGAAVVRAVRMRSLDGEPLGEVVSHVPAALGLAIGHEELAQTPMLALIRRAGHAIGGGSQSITAAVADPALASLLGIDWRAPVLVVERVVVDPAGTPLLVTQARYRADRYRIAIDLHTPARPLPGRHG